METDVPINRTDCITFPANAIDN